MYIVPKSIVFLNSQFDMVYHFTHVTANLTLCTSVNVEASALVTPGHINDNVFIS